VIKIDPKRLKEVVEAGEFFLHTPAQSNSAYIQYVEEVYKAPSVDWGTRTLDSYITPQLPGQFTTILGRPGNAKTSLLIYLAKREAYKIIRQKSETKCVVYVSWEEPVESIETMLQSGVEYTAADVAWRRADLKKIKDKAVSRAGLPIVIVGQSMIRDRNTRKPPMTVDRVRDAILALYHEFGYQPTLVIGDHLQEIPVLNKKDRISEVTEAVYSLADLAVQVYAPLLLSVQASREVDDHGLPIPALNDGQWTSAIEQKSFRMFGILRPVTIQPKNGTILEEIQINKKAYRVDKNLLILRLLKQRGYFPPLSTFPLNFDPALFTLEDREPVCGDEGMSPNEQWKRTKKI
jgi:KaiC/GvpD/RAD55 family RecA-like ATPase